MATIDFAQLSIADTVTSGKGKSANISYVVAGAPVYWRPGGLQVAFEPGSFGGERSQGCSQPQPATRVNMQFRASAIQDTLDKLDTWIVEYVKQNVIRILGKDMTVGEVHNRYQPCLKRSEKYEPTFKVKVNMEGPNQVRLWDTSKQARSSPTAWKGLTVTPRLRLKGLWLMGRDFGALWEATDLMFDDEPPECPF